jgi:hypothetical protein
MLAFLRKHVEDRGMYPVIRIVHRSAPQSVSLRHELSWRALILMERREMADQVAKEMEHTAGMFVAKATEVTIGAPRIKWEDRL